MMDVVIVGAGPSGIATALFLVHAAPELSNRIVVLDKERFPREKFCAGALGARGDKLLGSIGVTVDVPSAPISGIAFRAMERTLEVRDRAIGRVVRRLEFDHELVCVARRRGIRVLDGTRVSSVSRAAGAWRIETSAGDFLTRALVGADGVASVVRRKAGFTGTRYHAQALEVDTEHVSSDLARDLLLFDASNRSLPGYYWDFPTIVDGRELVCRGVYLLRTGESDPAIEIQGVLARELEARGLSLSHYKKKRYAERGFDRSSRLSQPGLVLVGEAAGIDPITGEGIAQALQYGAVCGRYLARKLRQRDLGFGDWADEVKRTMIGRDLLTRSLGVDLFYGPKRPAIERFLLDTPAFIRVGMQHFAGRAWSKSACIESAWSALRHTSRWALNVS